MKSRNVKTKEELEKEKILAKERELIYKRMTENQKKHALEEKIAPKDSFISLQNINKIYSNRVQAVFDFNLEIKEKEFIVFVGPSGCGKSTTLRMIAGLESITGGDLYIDGTWANDLEPKDRDVAMVFQSYALYPHMTVYDNMAFGLQVKHIAKEEIDARVHKAAKILEIEEFLDRKPKALSGGQCQRVALGRAIVRNSKVFLMDEPLSNLDAKLRVQMRSEIVNLHNELGATTIYVTHDQTEAMTMATRIVVMKKGVIQQIGTPKEIYSNPSNVFVATFIGSPAMNIIKANYNKKGIIEFENGYKIKLNAKQIKEHDNFYSNNIKNYEDMINNLNDVENKSEDEIRANKIKQEELSKVLEQLKIVYESELHPIIFGIRPEDVCQKGAFNHANVQTDGYKTKIKVAELLGNEYYIHSDFGATQIVAKVYAGSEMNAQQDIEISFDFDKIHLFDSVTTKRIL